MQPVHRFAAVSPDVDADDASALEHGVGEMRGLLSCLGTAARCNDRGRLLQADLLLLQPGWGRRACIFSCQILLLNEPVAQ